MNDSCDRYDCTNQEACFRCFDGKLYKPPKGNKFSSLKRGKNNNVSKHADNSWEGLEGQVVKDLNKIPSYYESSRQLRSGGIWYMQGDARDPIIFTEMKERKGNEVTSRGTKSFTIEKDWIEKGEDEARHAGSKPFFLPFRFKGDDIIRVVTKWDWIAELVCMVKSLLIENEKKDILLKAYRQRIKELGGNDEDIAGPNNPPG